MLSWTSHVSMLSTFVVLAVVAAIVCSTAYLLYTSIVFVKPESGNGSGLAVQVTAKSPAASDLVLTFPPSRRSYVEAALGGVLDDSPLTATGFSKVDIERLGDFPDYASLAGFRLPYAYPEFDIHKARPRLYRPIRWTYHQTMSLQKLESDWWLELENSYISRIHQRKNIVAEHNDSVMRCLPGAELACKELMEMALQFLCARYPHYFSLNQESMTFTNRILGIETKLREQEPLQVLLDHVPEDFALVLRDPEDGNYYFRAGVICTSQGWSLGTKMGMNLQTLHKPVPDYKERMEMSMDRFFARMPTDKSIERGSWALPRGETYFVLPGPGYQPNPPEKDPSVKLSDCRMRVDWQTLRRLPVSGAIVFNFKALFYPVTSLKHERYIPSLLLKNLREGKRNLIEHKRLGEARHVVEPALVEYERYQIASGLIEKDWEAHTMDEHPFFPGWEQKWHEEPGF